jgi:hypothetical protein
MAQQFFFFKEISRKKGKISSQRTGSVESLTNGERQGEDPVVIMFI